MQLSMKDVVCLSIKGGVPGDGFRLQQSAGPRKLPKTSSVRERPLWRAIIYVVSSIMAAAEGSQASTLCLPAGRLSEALAVKPLCKGRGACGCRQAQVHARGPHTLPCW